MKALGDYLHARGLRFGMYTAMGAESCMGCAHTNNLPLRLCVSTHFLQYMIAFLTIYDRIVFPPCWVAVLLGLLAVMLCL